MMNNESLLLIKNIRKRLLNKQTRPHGTLEFKLTTSLEIFWLNSLLEIEKKQMDDGCNKFRSV